MELNLRDAAQRVEHEELSRIRLAKIEEIAKTWDDLFFVLAGEEVFKKIPGCSNYSSFEKSMRQSLEEAGHHLPEKPITTSPHGDLLNQLGELLSVDYTPPQDGKDLAVDLITMTKYFRSGCFSLSTEMTLDLSLCKLIRAVSILFGSAKARGETIVSGRKKQREITNSNKAPIEEAYYYIKTKGKSLNSIAENIQRYLKAKGKITPSVKTITRYLKSNAKIKENLIFEGVIKDKPTPVQ